MVSFKKLIIFSGAIFWRWDSSVVRASDSWLKGPRLEPLQEQRENFLLQGQLSALILISVSVPPRVTTVACKRSWSFCQKRRWLATVKHACTWCMWLCMKWHGAWLYGVHRMHQDGSSFRWHQPCQCHKYTTSVDIEKACYKKLVTHVESHASAVSLLESGE